jgi:5,10-methylenetetrahydrofolate reductase
MAAHLNQGLDVAQQSVGEPTRFHLGAVVNPFAADLDAEWARLAHKIEAGAEFLVTPPVLDVDAFEAVWPRLRDTGLPVIAGVAALEGSRHAEFLASEVVGVRVAETVVNRLKGAADEREEAMRLTIDLVSWLRPRVQGLQITAFHGSPSTAERVVAELAAAALDGRGARRG